MRIVPITASLLAWLGALLATASAPLPADLVQEFLAKHFRLQPGEWRDLTRRQPVARSLDTTDGREIATLGVIPTRVPADFYIEQLRDVVQFKRGEAVLQIGRVANPARVEDFAGLTLEREDLHGVRNCRPASCDVQLSREAMARFAQEVPWGAPEAVDAANRLFRVILVDLVDRYRAGGDDALMIYHDERRPLSLAEEFRAMIAAPPAILERFRPLHQHLVQFPRDDAPGVEDHLYWSKEKLGPATIISVTHMAIADLSGHPPVAFGAASKQIYGSHYFDSSLGLTLLLRDDSHPSAASYVVYVNRSRLDALGGFFGGMKRAIVRSRTRGAMSSTLVQARDLVERRYRAANR